MKVLTFGANKYADRNWEKGINYGRLIAASLRHLYAWIRGERLDPETNIHHLAHMCCDVLFLLTYEMRGMSDFNDLPAYDRRDEKIGVVPTTSSRGSSVSTASVKEAGRQLEFSLATYLGGQRSDYRQAEPPGLDPDYCCEYNGA